MISVRVNFDFSEIDRWEMVPEQAKKNAFVKVGNEYQRVVRANVDAGKTPDGKRFVPYSKSYADRKKRAGRKVAKPDLTLTGAMWRAMVARLSSDGLTLTVEFPGMHEATRFKSAKGPEEGKKRSAPGQSLTVSRKGGEQIPTDVIAEANDMLRPFIGVSLVGAQKLFAYFVEEISRATDRGR